MGRKKKPFIDKKTASTYHILHRSQRDVSQDLYEATLAGESSVDPGTKPSDWILWPSPYNNPETDALVLGTQPAVGNANENDAGGEKNNPQQTMQEWRQQLAALGLLEESADAYMKEISTTGTFITPNGQAALSLGGGMRHEERVAPKIDLDVVEVKDPSMPKSLVDNIPLASQFLDPEMAQILAMDAFTGEEDEGGRFALFDDLEELNDDFVLQAAQDPTEFQEKEGGADDAFDYDAHIQNLLEKARRENGGVVTGSSLPSHAWAQDDQAFFANAAPRRQRRHGDGGSDDDEDSWNNKDYSQFAEEAEEEDASHAIWAPTVSTMPGVVPKLSPDEERALCEKFEETLLEYDQEDDEDEEYFGRGDQPADPTEQDGHFLPLDSKQVQDALDDFLYEKQEEIFVAPRDPSISNTGRSGFSALVGTKMVHAKDLESAWENNPAAENEKDLVSPLRSAALALAEAQDRLADPPVKPPTEEILIDGKSYFSERERNPFDVESILSTYSNLDNNPVTISSSSRRRRGKNRTMPTDGGDNDSTVPQIRLSKKTGLPIVGGSRKNGVNEVEDEYDQNGYDDETQDGLSTFQSVNRGVARSKNETPEEKRARKLSIKRERQMARIQKKVTKQVFQEEFARHAIDTTSNELAGQTVFHFS